MYRMNCKCGHIWSEVSKNLNCGQCDRPARDVGFANISGSPVTSNLVSSPPVASTPKPATSKVSLSGVVKSENTTKSE